MQLTRHLAREAVTYGLAPGLVSAGMVYLADVLLLSANLRGVLLIVSTIAGVGIAAESMRSAGHREMREAVDQWENIGYDGDDRMGGKSIEEAAEMTTGGFWPDSKVRRRALFYGTTVAVGCLAAVAVVL
jgi:hypothetical protein